MEQRATWWRVPSRESCKGFLRASVDCEEENAPFSFSRGIQARATRNEDWPEPCEVKRYKGKRGKGKIVKPLYLKETIDMVSLRQSGMGTGRLKSDIDEALGI